MRFRTKMILIYTSFIFMVALVLGFWYQSLSYKQYEANEYQNNTLLARQLVNQMDETIKPMEFVPNYLLSDVEVLNAIRILSTNTINSPLMEEYREEAQKTIRSRLQSYYLLSNFRRVIFFNEVGIVVANISTSGIKMNNQISIEDIPWIDKLNDNKGKPVLLSPHPDDWSIDKTDYVFSSVKKIQGNQLGYIEVQKDFLDLEELMYVPDERLKIVALLDNGKLFYTNFEINVNKIEELIQTREQNLKEQLNPYDEDELLSYETSKETGITFYVIEEIQSIRNDSKHIIYAAFLIAAIFLVLSAIFVLAASTVLSKPIQTLVELMEKTQLDNMELPVEDNEQHNEFKVLNQSYRRLLNRLNQSMIREKKLSLLQLQAQFDLLQTQVNPHFIYNVLNVLSNRGVINEDEKICDMCSSLAHMLRYATNTKASTATIKEEVEYLQEYFYLLKERYIHKIEYEIDVEQELQDAVVPRVLFQQFAENAIKHGFENIHETMKIHIHGYVMQDYWYVKVQDNGCGFAVEKIEQINMQIQNIHKKIMVDHENVELEIGGMGIVNAYGRMLLFYKEDFVFKFGNSENGGAFVLIGAPINQESRDKSV